MAKVLEIKEAAFEPLTKGAMGRFSFKPKAPNSIGLYGGLTTEFRYTFGDQAFTDDSVCQVWKTNEQGSAHSDAVSKCYVSSNDVRIFLAYDTTDFYVQILGGSRWSNTDANITGDLMLFG